MEPKPAFLGREQAAAFEAYGVAEAYPLRPPYPPETFEILLRLLGNRNWRVLDLGCGTGDLARVLAPQVGGVDAVDISAAMVSVGHRLPDGDHPRLKWLVSPAEAAPLDPPYGLATAGESLHWMEWDRVLPRLADALAPTARLAVLRREDEGTPWHGAVKALVARYSTNREWRPYDLIAEVERRGLFRKEDETRTAPYVFRQTVDEYVESWHSRAGLSRERMGATARAFDTEMRDLVLHHATNGVVEFPVSATVTWGRPLRPAA